MKTLAYIRVSTLSQELENQRLAILEYARINGIQIDDFIEIRSSSRQSAKERRIDALLELLSAGDQLIVSELSRLGRSLGQIVTLLDNLVKSGIVFISIKEGIKVSGQQDMQTKVMVALFGLFAEIERDLVSERTKEGLARARASGKKLGRPKGALGKSKLDDRVDEIQKLLKMGVSKASIAKITGVTRPTLIHFIRTRGLGNS